ncbi:MAG: biopolymer transporter ExbD [Chthoniobacterales bacterium]
MKFYTKKRRAPTITIVALVDILAILLIFFIVTTSFHKQEPAFQIKLPESDTAKQSAEQKAEPIILQVKGEKELSLDSKSVTLENLAAELGKIAAANPNRPINMRADETVPFGVIVKVTDSLTKAGVKAVQTSTRQKQ